MVSASNQNTMLSASAMLQRQSDSSPAHQSSHHTPHLPYQPVLSAHDGACCLVLVNNEAMQVYLQHTDLVQIRLTCLNFHPWPVICIPSRWLLQPFLLVSSMAQPGLGQGSRHAEASCKASGTARPKSACARWSPSPDTICW